MALKDRFQRFIWSCMYISFISGAITIVVTLWDKFLTHPTVTSLASSSYPVNMVPFPAISVCSMNKISKKRAQSHAEQIAKSTGRNLEEIMEFIYFVGSLYNNEFDESTVSKLLEFQNILDMLQISVRNLTKNLVTPCDELLKNCYWRNVKVNCSSVFITRLTFQGYCCVFNYVKMTDEVFDREIENKPVSTDAGVENGLYVSVYNYLQDYYFTALSSAGIVVHIFSPNDYPDKNSGSLVEIFAEPNSENFIDIIPTTLTSVPDVANFPLERRKCLFDKERTTRFQGAYSPSDCNVDCRLKSIKAICQCIPFFIPFNSAEGVCTLADIPCISNYQEKWNSFYPDDDDVGAFLAEEMQDSLRCEDKCYSSCSHTVYEAFSNSFPIFNNREKQKNITHLYIYYLNRFSNLYVQDIVYYWYELLSSFGGVFGIFIGWSLVSCIQLTCYYLKIIVAKLSRLV